MRRHPLLLVMGALLGLVLALGVGLVLTAPDTAIPWRVFGSGGGTSSSTNFDLGSTAGQSAIGESGSTNYDLGAGFWYGVGATGGAPTPTPTDTPTPSGPTPTATPTATPGGPTPTPTGPTPDLVGTIAGPGSACPGQPIQGQVTLSVSNLGQNAAGTFSVGVYISADATITTSDLLLSGGREFLSSLNGTTTVAVPLISGSVPLSTPLGAMYLGLLVDEFNAVAESNETNNDSAVPITITPNFDGDTLCDDVDPDDDNDGCTDVREQQPKSAALTGGGRNPHYFWDFMDQWTANPPVRDKVISVGDIGAVVARFTTQSLPLPTKKELFAQALTPPTNTTSYHPTSDRAGADPTGNVWDLFPPDGVISVGDIGAVVAQFTHNCN